MDPVTFRASVCSSAPSLDLPLAPSHGPALRRALAHAGWPLQECVVAAEQVAELFGAGARALSLVRASPVPAWLVESEHVPAERAERAALRLAKRSPGRAALVLVMHGSARWSIACCPFVAKGAYSWSTGASASVDREVWSALLDALAPSVAALRVGAVLERRDIDRRFFADVRAWTERVSAAWNLATDADDAEDASPNPTDSALDEATRQRLSMTLLARLMFLTFVQTKGWLADDQHFLSRLLLDPDATQLYATRLQPLFFDALNKTPDERATPRPGIPFLNGGLFERSADERRHPALALPDRTLSEGIETIFARYRFVDDERAIDGGAIDPVMLGSVFERLMHPKQRRRSGTFFTPPELVDELVDRAMRHALTPRLGPARLERARRGRLRDREEAAAVLDALEGFRVLDPAAGSGAFLLGALEWLAPLVASALRWTEPERSGVDGRARRKILRDHLYAIDLSPTAVLLCELRLWLSLAAALPSGGPAYAEALPTLAPRVIAGDALAGSAASAPPDGPVARRLRELRARYVDAVGREKRALRTELDEAEKSCALDALDAAIRRARVASAPPDQLGLAPSAFVSADADHARSSPASSTPVRRALAPPGETELEALRKERDALVGDIARPRFDPLIHFSEAFEDGGFDVVFGNPPWVRLSSVPPNVRERLRRQYRWMHRPTLGRRFGAQPDLSVAFVERALQLCRAEGVIALVLPAKLFVAGYGERMRMELETRHTLLEIDDRSWEGDALFAADAYPALLVARPGGRTGHVTANGRREQADTLRVESRAGAPWVIADPAGARMRRARGRVRRVRSDRDVWMGVKTGANRVFVDPDPSVPTRMCVQGRDLRVLGYQTGRRLIFAHDPTSGRALTRIDAATAAYLEPHAEPLAARADARARTPIWSLFRVRPASLGWRVVWRELAPTLQASILPPVADGGPVALNTVYGIATEGAEDALRWALWLNSAPVRWWVRIGAEPALGGYVRFRESNVGAAPAPLLHACARSMLRPRARDVAAETVSRVDVAWSKVDVWVADALGLSDEERALAARWSEAGAGS